MAVTVTDPDVALDGLRSRVDWLLGMTWPNGLDQLQHDPGRAHCGVWPQGCWAGRLSTDLLGRDNLSHPRTSVRGEGR